MKIVAMVGNSPRHFAIAKSLFNTGKLKLLIVEKRETRFPEPPSDIPSEIRDIFVRHFQERDLVENKFFPLEESEMPGLEKINISREELNSDKTFFLLKKENPDLLISYGVHKLTPYLLSAVNGKKWNTHGGLSPWYRGVTTHFWPTYMLEPQMTGMTVHQLTEHLDGGDIVHQTSAKLVRGDGVHETACRAVLSLIEEWPRLIELFCQGKLKEPVPQKSSGKLWLERDWKPHHLIQVYKNYENRVVDAVLDGKISQVKPELIRQW